MRLCRIRFGMSVEPARIKVFSASSTFGKRNARLCRAAIGTFASFNTLLRICASRVRRSPSDIAIPKDLRYGSEYRNIQLDRRAEGTPILRGPLDPYSQPSQT